jgi:DNA invertase Pin-like site-specific DNA recombinase
MSGPNLIGVIRVSTDEQAREGRAGQDRQRHDIASIQRIYSANLIRSIEVIESGAHVRDQEDFQQLFRDLARPGVDGVAVSNLDRLVRPDKFEDFMVLDYFRSNKKKIYTPGGIIDPASQSGFLESGMRAMFAGMERQFIRQRTMDGKERIRRRGEHVMGYRSLPRGVLYDKKAKLYSYDLDAGAEKIHPLHIPGSALQIREAFRLLIDRDLSFGGIAKTLGAGWTEQQIRRTLTNPIWVGIRRYDKAHIGEERKGPSGKRYRLAQLRSDPWEHVAIEEPLISPAMFDKAQEIIQARSVKDAGMRAQHSKHGYLGTGLLRCKCGSRMYTMTMGGKGKNRENSRSYYCCARNRSRSQSKCSHGKYIQTIALDRILRTILIERLLDTALIQRIIAHNQKVQPVGSDRARERELAQLKEREERLINLRVDGEITREQFSQRKKELDGLRVSLTSRYPKESAGAEDATALARILVTAFAQFAHLPQEQQRDLLHRAVREIMIVGRELVSVTLRGGFLGEFMGVVKLQHRSPPITEFNDTPDLVLAFPQPIEIPRLGELAA